MEMKKEATPARVKALVESTQTAILLPGTWEECLPPVITTLVSQPFNHVH